MSAGKPRLVSLFSGCGGFDLGFDRAGFDIVAAHDADPLAVATYNQNLASRAFAVDLRRHDSFPDRPDIMIAGPPCQGFSTIGRLDPKDERNDLLLRCCDIAGLLRPKLVVIENVAGLTYKTYAPLLAAACERLTNLGYHIELKLANAQDFGVPQRRKRLFLVARSDSRPFSLDLPTSEPVTIGTALENASGEFHDDFEILKTNSASFHIAARIQQGQKLCNVRLSDNSVHTWQIPEVFGVVSRSEVEFLQKFVRLRRTQRRRRSGDADPVPLHRLRHEFKTTTDARLQSLLSKGYLRKIGDDFDLTHTFNGTYRRLEWQGVSPTVDTHFGSPRLFLHPLEHRGVSSREASLLQGFPSDFLWPSDRRVRYRLIGNAVPPPLAHSVAKIARELL